jgi:hypothetical protein
LDIRARHPADGSAISVEIDRGNKSWSLRKLEYAAGRGDLALWLRWNSFQPRSDVPETVRMLRAGTTRRRLPGSSLYVHSLAKDSCA